MLFVGVSTWYCGVGSLILMNNFLCLVFLCCLCFNRFGSWALVEGVADRLVVIGILFCKFEFFFLAGCSVGSLFLSRAVGLAGIIVIQLIK